MSVDCTSDYCLTFGVISDIQYADHDDCLTIYGPVKTRYYRHGLSHVRRASEECIAENCQFILQLGDLIDGKSRSESEKALGAVMDVINDSKIKFHHTLGNHELYNFKHSEAVTRLIHTDSLSERAYYAFEPRPYIKIISMDTYDLSMNGRQATDSHYEMCNKYLSKNPNEDLNSPEGLEGLDMRFVKFNGGVGREQLKWLSEQLADSDEREQKVIVFGHIGVNPASTSPRTLLWNYEEVMEILEGSPSVAAVLSGHYHAFKHAVSPNGKHYVSFKGVVETPQTGKAWGIMSLSSKSIKFKIHDNDKTLEWEASF